MRKRRVCDRQALWAWPAPPPVADQLPKSSVGSTEVMRLLDAIEALGVADEVCRG